MLQQSNNTTDISVKKLIYCWQIARRIYAMQWRGWPPKTRPSRYVLCHAEFGRSTSTYAICINK